MSTTKNLTVCFADVVAHAWVAEVVAVAMAGEFVVVGPKDAKAFDFRPARLIAVGPEGGAALARWVAEHGLEGVQGIGLVGVTAPWAERHCERGCAPESCYYAADAPLPLGPLEPLRAVAGRARRHRRLIEACAGAKCKACEGAQCPCCGMDPVDGYCKVCDNTGHEPIRLVVACAPDDGVCDACVEGLTFDMDDEPLCRRCDGLGKALSSANVAKEVCGFEFDRPAMANWRTRIVGGVSVVSFLTAKHLTEDGLRAVVEGLTR